MTHEVEQGLRQRIRDLLDERDDARGQVLHSQAAIAKMQETLDAMRGMVRRVERTVATLALHLEERRERVRRDVLTPTQAADLLGIPLSILAEMREDGSGPPFVRLGGQQIRYTWRGIDAWLRRHEASRVA